jgi:hypothetical protein
MKAFPYLQRQAIIFISPLHITGYKFYTLSVLRGTYFSRFWPVLQGIIFIPTICNIYVFKFAACMSSVSVSTAW